MRLRPPLGRFERKLFTAAIVAASCCAATPARAQEGPVPRSVHDITDAVRRAVNAGASEYRKGNLEEARTHFQEAWRLQPSRGLGGTLADIEMRLGNHRAAAEYWQYFLERTDDEVQRAAAEEKLAKCVEQLARVRVELDVPGATLSVDGRPVEDASRPEGILVEPGSRVLRVERPGYRAQSVQFVADAGQLLELRVRLEPDAAQAPAETPQPTAASEEPETSTRTVAIIGGATLTTAALVTGVVFGLKGAAEHRRLDALQARIERDGHPDWVAFNGQCHPNAPRRPASCDELWRSLDQGNRHKTRATAAYVVGGVLGLATLTAWFLWPTSSPATAPEDTAWTLEPWSTPDTQGFQLSGTF